MKISLLRKYMPSIWRTCFNKKMSNESVHAMFQEPMERSVFDKLTEDSIIEHNRVLIPTCHLFEFLKPEDEQATLVRVESKESAIVLIHWIGVFIGTCFFPQTRRCALEMLLQIAKASSLEVRLQYVLPYVLKMFDDKQPKVQAKAIEVAVKMFEGLIDSEEQHSLSSTDYKVFDNYIMPQFTKLQKNHKDIQMVQVTYTRYLPLLAKIGHRFTELSVASRLSSKSHSSEGQEQQSALQPVDASQIDSSAMRLGSEDLRPEQ